MTGKNTLLEFFAIAETAAEGHFILVSKSNGVNLLYMVCSIIASCLANSSELKSSTDPICPEGNKLWAYFIIYKWVHSNQYLR